MNRTEYPRLVALANNVELWNHIRDLDVSFDHSKSRLPTASDGSDGARIAHALHEFGWGHYYIIGVFRYKTKEIARGIMQAADDNNYIVLFNLARAYVEHTASLAYQDHALTKAVEEIEKQSSLEKILASVATHQKSIHRMYYGGSSGPISAKRIHVNELLEALEKKYPGICASYEALCEFVHPNYGSNALVSSGALASGKIGVESDYCDAETKRAILVIENCSDVGGEMVFSTARSLMTISNAIEICGAANIKASQIFSLRSSRRGVGATKEDAIYFHKARSHYEQMQAFYKYLEDEKLDLIERMTAGFEDGFLLSRVVTNRGVLWFKYRT